MRQLLEAFIIVTLGMAALLSLLGFAYWMTRLLPDKWQNGARAWVFVFPAVFSMTIGLVWPLIKTTYDSFFDDTGDEFVGLGNYSDIWQNPDTRLTVLNTAVWVFLGTAVVIVIGLTVARFADGMRGESTWKSAIFIPGAISLVGAGVIWRFVYDENVGLLNAITGVIPGLPASMGGDGNRLWLLERGFGPFEPPSTAPGFNTFLLVVIFIWVSSGLAVVVFSAAIKGVPDEILEAARVDGATERQTFFRVTLPYIRGTVVVVATLTAIGALKAFDIVAVATGGRFSTSTVANEFYVTSFVQFRTGLAAALAVLIFVLVIPITIFSNRAQKKAEENLAS